MLPVCCFKFKSLDTVFVFSSLTHSIEINNNKVLALRQRNIILHDKETRKNILLYIYKITTNNIVVKNPYLRNHIDVVLIK